MRIFAVIAVVAFLGVLLRGYKVVVPSVSGFFVDPALTQESARQNATQNAGRDLAQIVAQNLAQNAGVQNFGSQSLDVQNLRAQNTGAQNLGSQNPESQNFVPQSSGQRIAQSTTTPSLTPIAPSGNLGEGDTEFGLSSSSPEAMQGSMQRMIMEEEVSQSASPDGMQDGSDQGFSAAGVQGDAQGGTRDRLESLSGARQSERILTNELSERRRLLDLREEEIIKKEALLGAAEKQLMVRQKALEAVRDEIDERIQNFDTQQQEALSNIMLTYNVMKPRAAAAIF